MNNTLDNDDIFNPSDNDFGWNSFEEKSLNSDERKFDVTHLIEKKKKRYFAIFTVAIAMIAIYSFTSSKSITELPSFASIIITLVVCAFMILPLRARLKFLAQYQGKQYITLSRQQLSFPYFMLPDIIQRRYNYKFDGLYATYKTSDVIYIRHFAKPRRFPSTQIRFSNGDYFNIFQSDLGTHYTEFQKIMDQYTPPDARTHDLKKYAVILGQDMTTNHRKRFFLLLVLVFFGMFSALTGFFDHVKSDFTSVPSMIETFNHPSTETAPSASASGSDMSEAMTWSTDANPAFLTEAKPESVSTTTWPNGQTRSEEPMVNGAVDGMASYYHENGNLYGKIPYLHGQKHGHFDLFLEDGQPDQSLTYKNGVPHGVLTWHTTKESWLYVNGVAVKKLPYEPQANH